LKVVMHVDAPGIRLRREPFASHERTRSRRCQRFE